MESTTHAKENSEAMQYVWKMQFSIMILCALGNTKQSWSCTLIQPVNKYSNNYGGTVLGNEQGHPCPQKAHLCRAYISARGERQKAINIINK